jgi:PTH1 family peptidyl-tRNA hydrolase
MKLFVGLGNPRAHYALNRHNVGFMAVDAIAAVHDFPTWRKRFSGLASEGKLGGKQVLLFKPQTFMNESGRSVEAAAKFYKTDPEDLLAVHDEVDLDLGRMQARLGGGLAGHNGLRSVASALRTPEFLRLRIGVGRPERGDPRPVSDWVLSPFEPDVDVGALVGRAADAIETLVREGLEEAQQRFNER